jgi:hypothetical protein
VIVVLRGTVLCSMQLSRGVATPKTMVVDAAFGYLWCFTMVRVTSLTCFAPISLVLCPVVSCSLFIVRLQSLLDDSPVIAGRRANVLPRARC